MFERATRRALVILVLGLGASLNWMAARAEEEAKQPIQFEILVPADAVVLLDGAKMSATGPVRRYKTPPLESGRRFYYDVTVRVDGKEYVRRISLEYGEANRFDLRPARSAEKPVEKSDVKGKDKQVVTTKPTKRVRAASINFRKAYDLPLASLGTLGTRIDAARRAPDPVALAHAAGELAVGEKVSGKKASLTSRALLAEAAELARLRKQVAELKAVYAVHQQIAAEETDKTFWTDQIAQAESITKAEKEAIQSNELPTDAPRRVLVNNYTTQYIDIWVNGTYKMQVPPGGSKWCTIEHKWNPTVLTGYGDEDEQPTWGPNQIYGEFKTYTWNLQG